VIVLAGLVPSHASGQGRGRYAVWEGGSQEVDCCWVASVGDATGLDELHVWRICGRRTGLLAETHPSVRVCCHSNMSRWVIHWSRIDVCGCGLVGDDRRARPKVSLMGSCEGQYLWYSQSLVRSRCALLVFDVGHSNRWSVHLQATVRRGRMVSRHGMRDVVIMDASLKHGAKGEGLSMMERNRQYGRWVDARGEERIWDTLLLRRRIRKSQVWDGEWGMVWREYMVRTGWNHRCDEDCKYKY